MRHEKGAHRYAHSRPTSSEPPLLAPSDAVLTLLARLGLYWHETCCDHVTAVNGIDNLARLRSPTAPSEAGLLWPATAFDAPLTDLLIDGAAAM